MNDLATRERITPPDQGELYLPHLDHDLQIIRRYVFVHSNLPFTSNVPLLGPLLVAAKRILRWALRSVLSATIGTQDEFNAAVANVLFEFTRRAATAAPLTTNDAAADQALRLLANGSSGDASRQALTLITREIQLLRDQVRAAQLSASESERAASELLRRVAALEDQTLKVLTHK